MANLWKDLTEWLEEASNVVGKEAGDLTLKGSLKLEIFELKRKLREYFTNFGIEAFEQAYVKKNQAWKKNRKIMTLVKKIRGTQTKLGKKENEYKKIGKKTKKGTKKKKR
ncbi:hypothetical protein GQ543_05355 [candidate division WOR-3 bacterium]|jgi:hypothetical protein|nr:hypothetical protein [candidate division WOR-3 bacterium]